MSNENFGKCAECPLDVDKRICKVKDGFGPNYCSTKNYETVLTEADLKYREERYAEFAKQAAIQEFECYEPIPGSGLYQTQKNPRIVENCDSAKRWGYKRAWAMAFCSGLREEAAAVERIFRNQDSKSCRSSASGCKGQKQMGISEEQKIAPGPDVHESCSIPSPRPYPQRRKDRVHIVLGLCVGHDTMFLKTSRHCVPSWPQDRVTGPQSLAPHLYFRQT
jgi:uncharacterized metal-binding protein